MIRFAHFFNYLFFTVLFAVSSQAVWPEILLLHSPAFRQSQTYRLVQRKHKV